MANVYNFKTKVLFGDVDCFKIAYYTKFVEWCSKAREECLIEWIRNGQEKEETSELGILEELMQCGFVTAEIIHKFHRPAFLGDSILIEMTFNSVKRTNYKIHFDIYAIRENNKVLLGIHDQKIIMMDKDGKITRIPEKHLVGVKYYEKSE